VKAFFTLSILSVVSIFVGAFFVGKADFDGKLKEKFGDSDSYNFSWTNSSEKERQTEEGKMPIDGLKHLVLDLDSGEVKISPQSSDEKELAYKIKYMGEESPLNFSREGDLLKMSFKTKGFKNSFKKGVEVELLIPQQEIPLNFTAEVNFGSLELSPGLYFDDFNVDMSAGEMETEALSFTKGDIELSAGELKMESTDLKEASVSVSGGSVHLEVINPSPIVKADVNAGELEFGTVEGIEKNFTLEAEVSLGDINVVDGYTRSGDKYVYGEGKGRVELEVDLGEVEVF